VATLGTVVAEGSAARAVPVEMVRPLRAGVLRPGLPLEQSVFPGDDDPDAAHVAVPAPAPSGPGAEGEGEGRGEGRGEGQGGCFGGGHVQAVLAVGSLLAEGPPSWLADDPEVAAAGGGGRWWRIRGMATAEGWRRRGLGGAVLHALLERAASRGGGVVWCNARVPATAFYRRAGFRPAGPAFEVPGLGPHVVMWRVVQGRPERGGLGPA
jgi:GNAT superfamily N-acetyltransferase